MNHSMIKVTDLSFSYATNPVLTHLNFELKAGEVVTILGENGAGKTTLINLLLGQLKPQRGHIDILGAHPGDQSVKQQLGAMLQIAGLPPALTVSEYIRLFQSYYQQSMEQNAVIQLSGLYEQKNTRFAKLSGGQKQRLLFALAMIGNPKLIFLDEPTLAMDVEARHQVWQVIKQLKQQGKSVVLTTHYMEEADALSDHVIVLKNGEAIASGSPEQIKSRFKSRKVSFVSQAASSLLQSLIPHTVHSQGQRHVFYSAQPEQDLKVLLNSELKIEQLSVENTSLEQAFLSLTQVNKQEQAA